MAYMDSMSESEFDEFVKELERTLPDDPRKQEFIDFIKRRSAKKSLDQIYDDAMKGVVGV